MSEHRPLLTLDTREQPPILCGALSVTPQTQVVALRTPWGIWRWARPEALLVQGDHGLSRIPIRDATRWLCLGAWLVALMTMLLCRSCLRVDDQRRR